MTNQQLLTILESAYDQTTWGQTLRDVFGPGNYYPSPQAISLPTNDIAEAAYELGSFNTGADQRLVGVYEVTLKPGIRIEGKRVGLRQLLKSVYKLVDGALVVFTSHDGTWRFSYISEIFTYDAAGNRQEEKTDSKRFTYVLGKGKPARTPADRFYKLAIKRPAGLSLKDITEAFSVDALTKDFYRELSDWYFWARDLVTFPEKSVPRDSADDEAKHQAKVNSTSTIRLITRLMFVWFIKQKGLVPDALFDEDEIKKLIKGFQPKIDPGMFLPADTGDATGSTYYKAILQNLFFATLNTEMGDTERRFKETIQHREKTEFRYRRFFKDENQFLTLIRDVPFLNGGLFDCLDSPDAKGDRIDCFSDNPRNEPMLAVPDYLFFGEEKVVNLNKAYGDTKHGKQTVRGLIRLLNRYNFTVEENTPVDVEVALDPELLGKVFENLLASFNPETETTARKQTGSFYTPREIVEYMVDESLKAYLTKCLTGKHPGVDYTKQLNDIFNYSSPETNFDNTERQTLVNALYDCKILDPACGSGAFPLGMLQRMVHLLAKLDAKNEYLVQKAKTVAQKEFGDVLTDVPASERQNRINEIEQQFREHSDDYNRKLVLIEQCLHGVDIQPIAVQITKLRFFISLVVEQEPTNDRTTNRGIRPLPNLETKFVAANTLIGLERQGGTIRDLRIDKLEAELESVRHQHFRAKTRKTKKKYRDKDAELRAEISDILRGSGWKPTIANQLAAWNPYDQNTSSKFFDIEWMFNILIGFDIVIGNPPYGADINNISKEFLKDNYKHQDYQLDSFLLFTEKGIATLKEGGVLSYIIPNTLFTNLKTVKIRKLVLANTLISISHYNLPVFTAVVNTEVIIVKREKCTNNKVKLNFYDGNLDNVVVKLIDQKDWIAFDGKPINIYFNDSIYSLTNNFLPKSKLLGEICKVTQGAKPFQIGKGRPPQTQSTLHEKPYVSDYKKDSSFRPLLRGSLMNKYKIDWNDNYYISLGDWLAEPRYSAGYDAAEKIVIRQTGSSLIATLDSRQFVIRDNLYTVIPTNKDFNIRYILSIINSKLMNWYYQNVLNNEVGEALAQVKRGHIIALPIHKTYPEFPQNPFVDLVNYVLYLRSLVLSINDQIIPIYFGEVIDGLVYELYFQEELHSADCRFHEHLRNLPDVTALSSDNEKLALCQQVFAKLYDPRHPVRLSLFNLSTVPEVAIIEGKPG
ncbi:Eco57I restriction-modification methylase domain-containing protein [Spirosoma lituiforme]